MSTTTSVTPAVSTRKLPWWTTGDWNGLFGLGTNVLLNVIVLTGLCLFVVKIPGAEVYGRILPALGIALPLGNIWYAVLARRLAQRENRDDVTALPYGPSVPHMFIVVFVVMLPVLVKTGDPLKAWAAGLAWALIIGVVVLLGAVVGPWLRKITPRAAMLGSLAGISITFIAMRPASQMWQAPWIAFISFAFILVGWLGGRRMPGNAPVGLVAILVSTAVAWIATIAGWSNVLKTSDVVASFATVGLHVPLPGGEVLAGLADIAPLLATAIPLGIYNFTEAMTNVESAAAAGDRYSARQILAADGLGAIVGAFLGSPFPPAVYIGHPGWKAVGGRVGYSLATGIVISVLCLTGLVGTLLAIFPLAALVPVLLYIGMVIGAQATMVSPKRYAPAIILALVPNIAQWGTGQIDNALAAAGTSAQQVGIPALVGAGDIYDGMLLLGQGAVLVGVLWGAIACFVIDKKFKHALVTALICAALSFVGLINAISVKLNASPGVTVGYVLLAVVLAVFAFRGHDDATLDDELIFVNGTLMRGLELHGNLDGAEFLEEVRTAPKYRMFSIGDRHPGMIEAKGTEQGVAVSGELYQVPAEVLVRLIEGEPEGLYRGPVTLDDGRVVPGILAKETLLTGQRDISSTGDWRSYAASLA